MKPVATTAWLLSSLLLATPASPVELALTETARLTAERITPLGSFEAPVGVYGEAGLPVVSVEGKITRRAWRIPTEGLTTLQVAAPLRDQLEQQGYRIVFECSAVACGGFDFRFATEVLPGPNMYVNLSQYRYMTALLGPAGASTQAVGILVSVAEASAFVQIIHADTGAAQGFIPELKTVAADKPVIEPPPPQSEDVGDQLLTNGFVILSDLEFATGSSDLTAGSYESLIELAEVLRANNSLRVALVGHTDTVGGLEGNIALSRARAASVRSKLIEDFGVAPERLDAEGMGYLAPVAPNLTAEGRDENRRVEAVLLNTE